LVVKVARKRSTSSTFAVARINGGLLFRIAPAHRDCIAAAELAQ
jgi:hypothetical protein